MTVGRVRKFAFGGTVKAKGKDPDLAQDKRMVKSGIYQHETAQHSGKHDPIKLARGGSARLPVGMKATALQEHSPVSSAKRAKRMPPFVKGAGALQMPMPAAPSEPPVPQMYGNANKKRMRRSAS